jgi:hypothetical protein
MAAGRQPGSWLEDEDPFAQATAAKKEISDEALIFAQKFLIFTSGPGADLLAHWSSKVRNRKVSTNATLGELAYYNGEREFVEGIHQQIQFAQNGGQSPYKER